MGGDDGMSVHSSRNLRKEENKVELEIKLLEAIAIYPPSKLKGIHRHFVLYGLMEYLRRSFGKQFSSKAILDLLGSFYNLDMIQPDDEDLEMLSHEEEFRLPQSYFLNEES